MDDLRTEILGELLSDIDNKTFDLEAWKQKTLIVLKRIFGDGDEKIRLVENLNYNFSSWTLRDSSGGKSNDKVKEAARKIIEAARSEVLLLEQDNYFISVIKEELTGKEFGAFNALIEDHRNNIPEIIEFLSKLPVGIKDQILAKMVLKFTGR